MDIQKEIIDSIDILIAKAVSKYQFLDIPSVVTEVKGNKYKVTINGIEKFVKDGVGVSPTIGQAVWVHLPNGNIKDAYICALR